MKRYPWWLLLVGGCMPGPEGSTTVSSNPFITEAFEPPVVRHDVETPGTKETADRVLCVGGKVVMANPQIGIRPRFNTIGVPKEEIFHRGTRDVFITEGLARRCTTEGQLAAVLALELGKMVAEREAVADPLTRKRGDEPPLEMPVGSDAGGAFGSPDGTRRMELTRYAAETRLRDDAPPPSPELLARQYLTKAGYPPTDLEVATPALKTADGNATIEKLFSIKW